MGIHGPKHSGSVYVMATSSHDDAIDVLNGKCEQERLLATYVFASPPAAKYLTKFVRSNASFVNHIPANLLGTSQTFSSFGLHSC